MTDRSLPPPVDSSSINISDWSPPPPLPCRVLTYKPPNPLDRPPRVFANMRRSMASGQPANPRPGRLGAGPTSAPGSGMNRTNYAMPAQSGTSGQKQQQIPSSPGPNAAYQSTMFFDDHLGRIAMMTLGPRTTHAPVVLLNSPGMQIGGYLNHSRPQQPTTPTNQGFAANDPHAKRGRSEITIQVYLHSYSPAFASMHGIQNVEQWCRDLHLSAAFRHLKNQLSKPSVPSETPPNIRLEVYESLSKYKDIIQHSLNEREYRGLLECYNHINRFLRYVKKKSTEPGFVMPDNVNRQGLAYMANRAFIKEQMEDIRSGDGGKNRRRRAALREQLEPAFDDGREPARNEDSNMLGSGSSLGWPFNRRQSSAEQSTPPPSSPTWPPMSSSVSPGTVVSPSPAPNMMRSYSPQQLNVSPGPGQLHMNTQHSRAASPISLDPRLTQRASMQQTQPQQSPPQFVAPQPVPQQPLHQPCPPAPLVNRELMPPPPTPAQGYQRPGTSGGRGLPPTLAPVEGSFAKPYHLPPFNLNVKSIYRGVSQPYHNLALVIDSPNWATTAGIGVLKFGYEADWASGENIQRSGACFERVSLVKGMSGKRWLGDALVECFVGDSAGGNGMAQEGGGNDTGGVPWPAVRGGTRGDFGIGNGPEQIDEDAVRMLRKLAVPGVENVDFLEGEWTVLL